MKSLDLRAGGSVAALVILPTVLRVAQQFSVGVAGHTVPWALITELKTKIKTATGHAVAWALITELKNKD